MLTSGGTGVLLDVAALADEGVLGLVAGQTTLGLGPELRIDARHGAGNLALRVHGDENASTASRFVVVRAVCVNGERELQDRAKMKQLTRFCLSFADWCEVRPQSAHFSVRPRVCAASSCARANCLPSPNDIINDRSSKSGDLVSSRRWCWMEGAL